MTMPKIVANKNIPKQTYEQEVITFFRGVDLTNQPANVEKNRSCNGLNMIRDVPGKVRKRMGYEKLRQYEGRINGLYLFDGETLVHAGTKLFADDWDPEAAPREIASGLADEKSYASQLNGKLWFQDGNALYVYGKFEDGEEKEFKPARDVAYVPTVTISRPPKGGGSSYNPVNMLSEARKESFLGTEADTEYVLSFSPLTEAAVKVEVMNEDGEFVEKVEDTDFSVNRETGTVTFTTAPGESPVTGEDNVIIEYSVANETYKSKVDGCTFSICYGVAGASDRLFISGNKEYPNLDFFSQYNDPTYFGDLWYGTIGQTHSPIVGYSIVRQNLATHKNGEDNERNIYLRYGSLDEDGDPQFTLEGIIQGEGAVSAHTFGFIDEPMFLTKRGVCATTPYTYNSERYVQNRSFFLNGALLKEDLSKAHACCFNDFYMLAVSGKVYILDGLVRSTESSTRSDYQLEGYLWDNVPARIIENIDGRLFLGTDDGFVYRFFDDEESPKSYCDKAERVTNEDGQEDIVGLPIAARWDFDFSGDLFYRKKRIKYFAVQMAPRAQASCDIYVLKDDEWKKYLDSNTVRSAVLDFNNIDFDNFTFNTDSFPVTVGKKIKVKKFDSVRFSLRNEADFESFGFYQIALEYITGTYYKGGRR